MTLSAVPACGVLCSYQIDLLLTGIMERCQGEKSILLAFDCGKEAGCSYAYTGARHWLRRTALTLCWYCCVIVVVFEGPLMHNSFLGEAASPVGC